MLKHHQVKQRLYVSVRLCILLMLSCGVVLFSCKKKKGDDPADNGGGDKKLNACGFNGWPTAQTVGLPAGTPLQTVTKDFYTTKDGQVIEGLDVRARIYVAHKNVTVRNCILSGTDYYPIYSTGAGNDGPLLVENCDITGGISCGNNATFRNNHFYAPADGFKDDGLVLGSDNILIENNLIHNLRGEPHAHMDGIQIMQGRNITIRNNWIELHDNPETGDDGGPNSAIFVKVDTGPISNVTVECNMLIMRDGYYPLRFAWVTGNIVVQHNRWRYGSINDWPVAWDYTDAPKVWEDNAFEDGKVIANPY